MKKEHDQKITLGKKSLFKSVKIEQAFKKFQISIKNKDPKDPAVFMELNGSEGFLLIAVEAPRGEPLSDMRARACLLNLIREIDNA